MATVIIVGGGEHARVVADAARSAGLEVTAFVDPAPMPERGGIRQIASDEEALREAGRSSFILGIGGLATMALRRRLVAQYEAHGAQWARVIHAHAWISASATIGPGAVVLAGAVVNTGATIGAHAVVNSGAIIEHDVDIGRFALIAPAAAIGGVTVVGEDCFLGLGCRIRDHVTIGRGTVVGMGAVVVASLPDGVEVVGVPARVRSKVAHGHSS